MIIASYMGGGIFAPPPPDRGKNSERVVLEIKVESRVTDKPMLINSQIVSEICDHLSIEIKNIVLGYQIQYSYRTSTVNIFLKNNTQIEKFLRREPVIMNEFLEIRSVLQAGVKDVTMVVMGLDFMTED